MTKKTEFNLEKLLKIAQEKVENKDPNSYSYQLFSADFSKIAQKIGEEGLEVALATMIFNQKNDQKSRQDLIGEICDLYYHSLILMLKSEISLEEINQELLRRNSEILKISAKTSKILKK